MTKNRVTDQSLLDYVKTFPCLVCLNTPSDPDHVTTRGAGGGDVANNVWPLCRVHHTERHKIGLFSMIRKYRSLRTWLELAERMDVLDKEARNAVQTG